MATIYDDPVLAPGVAGNDHLASPADVDQILRSDSDQVVRALERAFGQTFHVIDRATGHVVRPAKDELPVDPYKRVAALYEIAQRGRPEIVDEVSPLLLVGGAAARQSDRAAAGGCDDVHYRAGRATKNKSAAAAHEFGVDAEQAFRWAQTQHALASARGAGSRALPSPKRRRCSSRTAQLKRQLADLSSHLLTTFEEITLLHRLTEHLSISKSVTDLCGLSVQWLADVVPAKSVAIWFDGNSELTRAGRDGPGHGSASPC